MADIADQASDREDELREAARRAHQNQVKAIHPKGHCLNPNCEIPFDGEDRQTKRFCDATCRDEYENVSAKKALGARRW